MPLQLSESMLNAIRAREAKRKLMQEEEQEIGDRICVPMEDGTCDMCGS